jgi:hypothetical protein
MSDDDILKLIRKVDEILEQKEIIQTWLKSKFPEAFQNATKQLTSKE